MITLSLNFQLFGNILVLHTSVPLDLWNFENWGPTLITLEKSLILKYPLILYCFLKIILWTSLVAEWLRIRLPVQGTRVRALVQEDHTCSGATKPVCHNYWACALEPVSHNCWARVSRARAAQQEKPPQWEARALQGRVASARRN